MRRAVNLTRLLISLTVSALSPALSADPVSLRQLPDMHNAFDSTYESDRFNPEFVGQRARALARQKQGTRQNEIGDTQLDAVNAGSGSIVVLPGARINGPIFNLPVIRGDTIVAPH